MVLAIFFSGTFGPTIDRFVKKRKLSANHLVLDDDSGAQNGVRINFKSRHTYEQLTPGERETVAIMADQKSINRTSNESYLSFRRVIPELPPLLHLKKYDQEVCASLVQPEAAPGREGGFVNLRAEAVAITEFLHDIGQLNLNEDVFLKPANDALKLTNSKSLCVYTPFKLSAPDLKSASSGPLREATHMKICSCAGHHSSGN